MLGGGATQLRWDGEGAGPDATAFQLGAAFNGRWTFPYGGYVLWNSSLGKGSGNGVIALIGQGASATLTPEGELDTMPAASAAVGYGHPFGKGVSLTVHAAWSDFDPSELRAPDRMKASITVHGTCCVRSRRTRAQASSTCTAAGRTPTTASASPIVCRS